LKDSKKEKWERLVKRAKACQVQGSAKNAKKGGEKNKGNVKGLDHKKRGRKSSTDETKRG